MATKGHENELISVEGVKATLQKFKNEVIDTALLTCQPVIDDLSDIRSGAAIGSTALHAPIVKYTGTQGWISETIEGYEAKKGSAVFLWCTEYVFKYDSAPDETPYRSNIVLEINGKALDVYYDTGRVENIEAGTVFILICTGDMWRVVNSPLDARSRSAYQKPSGGIPIDDLSHRVLNALNSAVRITDSYNGYTVEQLLTEMAKIVGKTVVIDG